MLKVTLITVRIYKFSIHKLMSTSTYQLTEQTKHLEACQHNSISFYHGKSPSHPLTHTKDTEKINISNGKANKKFLIPTLQSTIRKRYPAELCSFVNFSDKMVR